MAKRIDNDNGMYNEDRMNIRYGALKAWQLQTKAKRDEDARLTSMTYAGLDKDDPFAASRIRSHLLNNVTCPDDYPPVRQQDGGNVFMVAFDKVGIHPRAPQRREKQYHRQRNRPPVQATSQQVSAQLVQRLVQQRQRLPPLEIVAAVSLTICGDYQMKKFLAIGVVMAAILVGGASGCDDAQIASENISKAADNFEINRRVVFYNGITDKYMLSVEGRCSIGNAATARSIYIICKTGPNSYKKHFLGLSDNVTFFAEQLEQAQASAYHYRYTLKPQTIIPDIDFRGDMKELAPREQKQGADMTIDPSKITHRMDGTAIHYVGITKDGFWLFENPLSCFRTGRFTEYNGCGKPRTNEEYYLGLNLKFPWYPKVKDRVCTKVCNNIAGTIVYMGRFSAGTCLVVWDADGYSMNSVGSYAPEELKPI